MEPNDNPYSGQVFDCAKCMALGTVTIEFREEFIAHPIGSYSISGMQPKIATTKVDWPWAFCSACGRESKGKI